MENQINNLKKEIDKLLEEFFAKKQKEAEKLNPVFSDLVNQIAKMTLVGGKRIRPILVYYGYKTISQPQAKISDQQILSLSLCTELFQTACLIHDDIMDNAKTRRGESTIQKYFEKKYDAKLAENLSILAGDLALVWADELFHDTEINVEIIKSAQQIFNNLRQEVIFGQTVDLTLPYLSLRAKRSNPKTEEIATHLISLKVNFLATTEEKHILQMYEYKTARYSFVRPLQLGASLAGATTDDLKVLEDYAVPVGIAFQIQDDILGTFGQNSGKDSDSDIKEGKKTLLVSTSKFKIQNSKFKSKLERIFGNKNASEKEIEWVRNLIKESGSLKHCQDKAKKLVEQGKNSLHNSFISPKTKEFLLWLADFCLTRTM